jgi:MFS transporter, DHA1 family, tetracycline resistance protein
VILLSVFGSFLSYLIFAFARSLEVLFVSRMLAGLMGANIATAQAYIADITPPEERAKGMGIVGAGFGIGFIVGP